jgi:hypothetical protein
MKRAGTFGLLILAAIFASAGCEQQAASGIWYKWGKTLEEADDDCRDCYYEAVKYARANTKPYAAQYAADSGPLADYRDRYAMQGHGVGEEYPGREMEQLLNGARPYSYTSLRDRQLRRCMLERGYRLRSAGSLGGNLAKRQVPVAGDWWVAGIPDANGADPNETGGIG